MKSCPAPDCHNPVANHQFCCSFHWQRLPGSLRTRLTDLNYLLRHEAVPVSEVARCEADISRAMRWEIVSEDEPEPRLCRTKCPTCGRVVFKTAESDGSSVWLEEIRRRDEAIPTLESQRLFFIIGFAAVPANGHKGAYTPFTPHVCRGVMVPIEVKSPRFMLVGSTA